MDKQKICLDRLINSCKKQVAPWSTAMEKVSLNLYRNKKDNVLIFIGDLRGLTTETKYKYLNDYDVLSKEEIFLTLSTGCTGPHTIDVMLESFKEYHVESVPSDISAFLQSLEASKIIICYTKSTGGGKAALVILYKICKQINIDSIPIIIKPALYMGDWCYQRDFKDLLSYIDTYTYHIYDENIAMYKLINEARLDEIIKIGGMEILKIADSIMKLN